MICPQCGNKLDTQSKCPNCQSEVNPLHQEKEALNVANKQALYFGIGSLVITGISLFIFHFLVFIAPVLSIIGIVRSRSAMNNGQFVMGIQVLTYSALLLSSIGSFISILFYVTLLI